jgi:hypothetical protein
MTDRRYYEGIGRRKTPLRGCGFILDGDSNGAFTVNEKDVRSFPAFWGF